MGETEHITVATTSAGVGGSGEPGRSVDLPVVDVLTGRAFVTGKSGSGKSNTASVIAEKLLDNGFGLLIVDVDGEYYGLKEAYEILHVGADEECDIQVTVEHAEKIASLALEENVPLILDVSSFLDESEAEELLTEVSRHLFAKAKKQKQPFLMLVEECHEWIPEKGSVGECGKMLIKIGKRGRKHGLGIVGISQRPADVKKDFITQCDWLVWHRLTWNNDTNVVGRILDSEYADAVEDLDDGEAFLMTDWAEQVRRVQFHRKQTFDAGATPGLDDFERPELKSVSEDLVSELETISDEKERTEDRIAELREELDKKNSRIAELETELQDARDLSRMAEQFTTALLEHVDGYNPGRTEQERMRQRRARFEDGDGEIDAGTGAETGADAEDDRSAEAADGFGAFAEAFGDGAASGDGAGANDATAGTTNDASAEQTDSDAGPSDADEEPADATSGGGFGDAFGAFADDDPGIAGGAGEDGSDGSAARDGATASFSFREVDFTGMELDGTAPSGVTPDPVESDGPTPAYLVDLRADLRELDPKSRRMLAFYVEQGPDTPLNAHFSAGGSGDRTNAYAHNRELRLAGFVEHVGRGRYDSRLVALVREAASESLGDEEATRLAGRLRAAIEP
ncbi:MAG: helicase HerA domain-containing protein [Haloarculaceae archaeon]